MADNVVANTSDAGGATFATDEDTGGSRHVPWVKLMEGANGTFNEVGSANPLPVTANLSATDNAVLDTIDAVLDTINAKLASGTVIGDVNLGATDNAVLDAIDTVLDTINAKLASGTVIGDVNLGATDNAVLDSIVTNQSARSTGGSKVHTTADLNAKVEVTDSATSTVYWIHATNVSAAVAFLQIFDLDADNVTHGTTAATYEFAIPTQGDTNGAGFTINFGPHGIAHTTGLTIAASTASGGSTDPNGVAVTIGYQD